MREQTVCFSGHREIPFLDIDRIKIKLDKTVSALIEQGYRIFYTGGAKGFDRLAAECIIEKQKDYPDIELRIIFPYKNTSAENEYRHIIPKCESIEYASEIYLPWCYHERNKMLVDKSCVCVCYLTKQSGGTAYTVGYAVKNKLEIIRISDYDI